MDRKNNSTEFGKPEARRHSLVNLVNWAKDIFRGEVVMVPVHTEQYSEKIRPLVAAARDQWGMDEFVVRNSLRGDPLTMEKAKAHGTTPAAQEPGIMWRSRIIRRVANLWQG